MVNPDEVTPPRRLVTWRIYAAHGGLATALGLCLLGLASWEYVVNVWTAASVATLVFVAGTILAARWTYRLAVNGDRVKAWAASVFGNAATYLLTLLALVAPQLGSGMGALAKAFVDAGAWGLAGLVYAILAPVAWAHLPLRQVATVEASIVVHANA